MDLMIATVMLMLVVGTIYSLSLERLKYPDKQKKAYELDRYMISLISTMEKSGVLRDFVSQPSTIRNILSNASYPNADVCIYVEGYDPSTLYAGGSSFAHVYGGNCSSLPNNTRVYYRHIKTYNSTFPYMVLKFYAWYQ